MTESTMYQTILKPLLRKKGFYFKRFEQETIPDLYIAHNGRVLWAELKVINKPSNILKPDWRIGQLAFMHEHRIGGGGSIFCLILGYMGEVYFLEPRKEYRKEEVVCQRNQFFKMLMGD